jgi:hypothetical protein
MGKIGGKKDGKTLENLNTRAAMIPRPEQNDPMHSRQKKKKKKEKIRE